MYNEIILAASMDRFNQHVTFFETHLADIFQLQRKTGIIAFFDSVGRGGRRLAIGRNSTNMYYEFYKLANNGNIVSYRVTDLTTNPFVYKIYKSGGSGICIGYILDQEVIRITWGRAFDVSSILLNNIEYSGFVDKATSSFLEFPTANIMGNIAGFGNYQDLIIPCYSLDTNEYSLKNNRVENIYHFTNFKNIQSGKEITINGENYVTLSGNKILKY